MIKRRTLVRLTRLWLAFYIMTWCMTFTMSDVALASSLPEYKELNIYGIQNTSFATIGHNVSSGILLNNNGSMVFENVTAVFGSTTDKGGGALQVIEMPLVVNNTRFINNTNTPTGGAIYNIKFINNTSTGGAGYNTQFINNTSTDSAVYIEDGNVTINENMFINNTGSYQAIDQGFEEVLGNVTGRNTTLYEHVGVNNITQIVDSREDSIIRDYVGGNAFEGNRTVHLWKIDRINPGETAVIMFNQTVTQNDVDRGKIDNTMHVIVLDSEDIFPHFAFNQTIWTSDPVTITFDDSFTVTNRTIHRGSPIGSLPVPEKEGYILDGWYTESGVKVSPKTVINASMALYARWVEKEKPAVVSVPQTGDQWNVWLYAGIGIVAVIGLVVLILRRRK